MNITQSKPILDVKEENCIIHYCKNYPSDLSTLFSSVVTEAITAKQAIAKGYDNPNYSMQECLNKILKSEQGFSQAWKSPEWRNQFKDLETLIISAICQKSLSNKDRTIEIGAGKLENGLSYLMARIPNNLRRSIKPTDVNNSFIKNSSLKRVDLCKIDETYSPSSLNKIIGSSVLDTLSNSDLSLACQQIHATLKPGGLLLHFANMRPYQDTILTTFRELPYICFPWKDEDNFNGLMRIQKEELLNFISNNEKISEFAVGFLRWYSEHLTTSERELTLNSIIMGKNKTCIDFSSWIKELNPNGLEYIDNNLFFEERTKKALETAGFEIQEFGLRSESKIRDRNKDDDENNNYFSCEFGKMTAKRIYVLLPNKVCYAVKMHVIIAKKK